VTVVLPKELITTEAASTLRRSDYLGRLASQDVSLAGAENGSVSYRPSASPNYQTSFADAVPSQAGLLDDPTSINGNTDDTPIFASMLSRWFTEREEKPAAADEFTYYADAASEEVGWESDADAGWQAAEAASEPAVDEITAAGLPKRRPQAFLVPGSAAPGPPGPITNGQSSPPPARHASAVRDRMSSFQRGLTMGRHARPVKPVDESGAHPDWPDEETAEGNQ
jgi:hypothetical protein